MHVEIPYPQSRYVIMGFSKQRASRRERSVKKEGRERTFAKGAFAKKEPRQRRKYRGTIEKSRLSMVEITSKGKQTGSYSPK